jgi:hypothetical protein
MEIMLGKKYVFESFFDPYKPINHLMTYYHAGGNLKALFLEILYNQNGETSFINHSAYGDRNMSREEILSSEYQEQIKLYVKKVKNSMGMIEKNWNK